MTSRACLLPLPGDPFIGEYWLRNYERVWGNEVDKLYVFVNGQTDDRVIGYLRDRVDSLGGVFWSQSGRLVHGHAMRQLVQRCEEDLVLLMEDDAFVRAPGAVDSAFRLIEDDVVDFIGTPRGGMDPQIEAAAIAKWGQFERAGGGSGPGIWPCFFFGRTADLTSTSQRFESWAWQVGDTIPGLEYLVEDRVQTTDTFTTTAFELRATGLRFASCVQHKELWDKDLAVYPDAAWFHAGGLSNADFLRERGAEVCGARLDIGGTFEGKDWAHRIWWWRHILNSSPSLFPELAPRYAQNLDQLEELTRTHEQVDEWNETAGDWASWDDHE